MSHAVLLGDSIFDNARYVDGGPSVIQQVSTCLPNGWQATLLAVDGSVTRDVGVQLDRLPADASHLIISCGGNDALSHLGLMQEPVNSVIAALGRLSDVRDAFQAEYRRMLSYAKSLNTNIAVCTIYDSIPGLDRAVISAISLFNDVILRQAVIARVPVIDLRVICTHPANYSEMSPIEPSADGGRKIAEAIICLLLNHDYISHRCAIYT